MAKFLREIVAENIKKFRVREGMTQVELAKKAKLTDVYISRVEQNAKNLTLDSVEQIANALGMPISSFLENTSTQFSKPVAGTVKSLKHAIKVLEAYIEALETKKGN